MPAATGSVSDLFGPNRDRAIGLFSSVFPVGGVVGPVIGGIVVTYWPGIFIISVPIGIILAIGAARFVPREAGQSRSRVDFAGAALLVGSLLCLMLALGFGGKRSAGCSHR